MVPGSWRYWQKPEAQSERFRMFGMTSYFDLAFFSIVRNVASDADLEWFLRGTDWENIYTQPKTKSQSRRIITRVSAKENVCNAKLTSFFGIGEKMQNRCRNSAKYCSFVMPFRVELLESEVSIPRSRLRLATILRHLATHRISLPCSNLFRAHWRRVKGD